MLRQLFVIALFLGPILGSLGAVSVVEACAGYTISVGSTGTPQQNLLTQVVSQLISERTGTKIQTLRFESQAELLAAAVHHEVDLIVTSVKQVAAVTGAADKLVLLGPFGLAADQVAPALQVAAMKKFPALKRLLNRLAGTIDDTTLQRLVNDAAAKNPRAAARSFLIEQKLIFGE